MMRGIKKIGIIGGAGPMGGSLLFNNIIKICQREFHCHRDADFPFIHFINYPFSEMLGVTINRGKIEDELAQIANSLDVDYLTIACNTLHAFINNQFPIDKCIHLLSTTKEHLKGSAVVLCSQTARDAKIHQRFFTCTYPPLIIQDSLNKIIDRLLADTPSQSIYKDFFSIITEIRKDNRDSQIVLGCTEFSLLHSYFPIRVAGVIDPLDLVANKLCHLYFK